MNIALWTVAGLLALGFLASGAMKMLQPKEEVVAAGAPFLAGFTPGNIKVIGLLEVLGAIGLVAPGIADIAPVLVPVAAIGLVVMVLAAVAVQWRIDQRSAAVGSLVGIVLLVFVAWGRLGPESFLA